MICRDCGRISCFVEEKDEDGNAVLICKCGGESFTAVHED
jgi:hypothetical protein